MSKEQERREREDRAKRLVWARKNAGFSGAKAIEDKLRWNINNYKAHEASRNGFGIADARRYAKAFKVSLNWLNFGIGSHDDMDDGPTIVEIPLLTWISAGAMQREDIQDEQKGTVTIGGLPEGDWIALQVHGDSMDRVSPPESVILVDRSDKELIPNALYVIDDGEGNATYKRYRPGPPMRFEPVSTNTDHEPIIPDNHPTIIGRVRRSILEM